MTDLSLYQAPTPRPSSLGPLKPAWARKFDIKEAPFMIGMRVRVTRVIDATTSDDFVGREGQITYYEYDCGCGQQYPRDPMIGVKFSCRTEEEFWPEELEMIEMGRHVIHARIRALWPRRGTKEGLTEMNAFVDGLRVQLGYGYKGTFELFKGAGVLTELPEFETLMQELDDA